MPEYKRVTRIISAFPATGKSFYFKHTGLEVLDSDSSLFSWSEPEVRNPEFPQNYINHITFLIDESGSMQHLQKTCTAQS
mgnify:CR=1 FL=1